MGRTILEEFAALREEGRSSKIIAEYVETRNDDPGTIAFWERYQQSVEELRRAWGEPVHEGAGPRAGSPYSGPAEFDSTYFGDALHLAWWRTDDEDAVFWLSGHDADSLLFLHINISPRKGLASTPPSDT